MTSSELKTRKMFLPHQWKLLKNDLSWLLFLAPTLITIFIATYYPLLKTFVLSFYMSRNGSLEHYLGLLNYNTILTDPHFWNAFYNTVYILIFDLVIGIPCSFILASVINSMTRLKNFYKSLYFLPNVTSVVAISLVFKFMFYPSDAGIINYFLGRFGLGPYGWLNDPSMSKIVIIIMSIWHGIGYNTIIWIAGLQSISQELYEAATVDGANSFQKWRFITIPLSRPIFVFMIVMGTMGNLRRFSDVYTLGTATGSPLRSIQTIVAYLFDKGMLIGQYGVGAAATVVVFFIIMIVTIFNLLVTNKSNV